MRAPQFWRSRNIISILLIPLSWLYCGIATYRKHRALAIRPVPLEKPVIIIGNITVGGAGKTPVTLSLIQALSARGYQVGVISRGYRRRSRELVIANSKSTIDELGDEPFLLYQKTKVPCVVYADRYVAARALLKAKPSLDLIISDDGLQHYYLPRQLEIAVIGRTGLGNHYLLPAGPLREPVSRLKSVDMIVHHDHLPICDYSLLSELQAYTIQQSLGDAYELHGQSSLTLAMLQQQSLQQPVIAIAGIAYPETFFQLLREQHIRIIPHAFPDHYVYRTEDFSDWKQSDSLILMTEKDAVKCQHINLTNAWVIPLITILPTNFVDKLIDKVMYNT